MRKKITLLVLLGLLLTSLTGCATDKKKVVYTVYPLGYLLEKIGGDRIEIQSLQDDTIVQRAAAAGDLKERVKDADLVLHIGQLEPYFQLVLPEIRSASSAAVKDLSVNNSIYSFKRYTRVIANDVEQFVESAYYKGDAFDSIDMNEKDLALWMDPIAMTSMAKEIRDWLCENYVEESRYFEENYSQLESELVRLDAEYQSLSSTLKNEKKTIKFVSMTASFGNWQKTYGLQVYPVILSKYGVLPNEKQLDIIKTKIVEDNVKYIAYEPNMTEDMLALFDQLSAELNLQRVDLSNLSSLSADQREDNKDYLSIMVENLNQLESMAEDDLTPAVQEPAADDQAANEDEDA